MIFLAKSKQKKIGLVARPELTVRLALVRAHFCHQSVWGYAGGSGQTVGGLTDLGTHLVHHLFRLKNKWKISDYGTSHTMVSYQNENFSLK